MVPLVVIFQDEFLLQLLPAGLDQGAMQSIVFGSESAS